MTSKLTGRQLRSYPRSFHAPLCIIQLLAIKFLTHESETNQYLPRTFLTRPLGARSRRRGCRRYADKLFRWARKRSTCLSMLAHCLLATMTSVPCPQRIHQVQLRRPLRPPQQRPPLCRPERRLRAWPGSESSSKATCQPRECPQTSRRNA
jgi:hypothetical protein